MIYLNSAQKSHLAQIEQSSLTTEDIAGKCGLYEYFALRASLGGLEEAGYIVRSKESCWRWSLTPAGQKVLAENR